jgi:hypothetical protein
MTERAWPLMRVAAPGRAGGGEGGPLAVGPTYSCNIDGGAAPRMPGGDTLYEIFRCGLRRRMGAPVAWAPPCGRSGSRGGGRRAARPHASAGPHACGSSASNCPGRCRPARAPRRPTAPRPPDEPRPRTTPPPPPRSSSASQRPNARCLGHRPIVKGVAQDYVYQTFGQVTARVARTAAGIRGLGLGPRDKVAVLSVNCPEWMITMQVGPRRRGRGCVLAEWVGSRERRARGKGRDGCAAGAHAPSRPRPRPHPRPQACNRNNFVCVPLYETLGEDAIEYILDHSGARLVAVAAKRLGRVARALKTAGGAVEAVVYFGGEPSKEEIAVRGAGRGPGGHGGAGSRRAAAQMLQRSGAGGPCSRERCDRVAGRSPLPHPLVANTLLQAAGAGGARVMSFDELEAAGAAAPVEPEPPVPEDLSTIMYTSGTTGEGARGWGLGRGGWG